MKIQHPNFCRQMLSQIVPHLDSGRDKNGLYRDACEFARNAVKFALPKSGRLFNDPSLRALDENLELRLPFPTTALEYFHEKCETNAEGVCSTKRIMLAVEEVDAILVLPICWLDDKAQWACYMPFKIPKVGCIVRDNRPEHEPAFNIQCVGGSPAAHMSDDLGCVLGFLNALQCSNVKIDKSSSKAGNVKSVYPFDSYHVLTIESAPGTKRGEGGSSHRSPREHLRRGHIRRLPDKKIWVNAAVIGAGKGGGKITKDYKLA